MLGTVYVSCPYPGDVFLAYASVTSNTRVLTHSEQPEASQLLIASLCSLQPAQGAAQSPGPAEDKRCVRSCKAGRLRTLAVGGGTAREEGLGSE